MSAMFFFSELVYLRKLPICHSIMRQSWPSLRGYVLRFQGWRMTPDVNSFFFSSSLHVCLMGIICQITQILKLFSEFLNCSHLYYYCPFRPYAQQNRLIYYGYFTYSVHFAKRSFMSLFYKMLFLGIKRLSLFSITLYIKDDPEVLQ